MTLDLAELKKSIADGRTLLDVRAPVEFASGYIPGAKNLPLLTDEERAAVGTIYKQKGSEAAVALGHELVRGETRDSRVSKWVEFCKAHPKSILYCFRGGLRSQTVQSWLHDEGIEVPRLKDGYKSARTEFLRILEDAPAKHRLLVIAGPTGSGKTQFLHDTSRVSKNLDLERFANHRGSAFGFLPQGQPQQAHFENEIAAEFIRMGEEGRSILVEDESQLIGKCVIPATLFARMREAPVLCLEVELKTRVENIFKDYILSAAIGSDDSAAGLALLDRYMQSLKAISSKLGGLKYAEILDDMQKSRDDFSRDRSVDSNRVWIEKVLVAYYDPYYRKSLDKRAPKILFRGTTADALKFIATERN